MDDGYTEIDIIPVKRYNGRGGIVMIVMQYGNGVQGRGWHVCEEQPAQYLRIYLIHGGEVVYRDGMSEVRLKAGRLYIFPAQTPYSLTQNPDEPIDCLWLHADVFPYIVRRMIEIDPEMHPDYQDTLKLLRRQIDHPTSNAACIEAFGIALLQLLIRDQYFCQRIESSLIRVDGIDLHDSVRTLSRRAGYTQEHFIRAFTKDAGVTPYQYILSQRMNEAISLMRQGLMMDEIATRVGYASGKSFAGAFKRRFGMAPDVYREHFLKRA